MSSRSTALPEALPVTQGASGARSVSAVALAAVLLAAVVLRVAVAAYLGDVVDAPSKLTDQRSYHALGERLLTGHGFTFAGSWYPFTPLETPTAHWSYLQSLYVAGVYALFGVHPLAARLITAVLGGLLLPWLLYRLTRRALPFAPPLQLTISHSPLTIALLAALLASLYPYFILYAATLMTETFYICALLWSFERALAVAESLGDAAQGPAQVRKDAWAMVGLGVALGVATLSRQAVLPWVVVLFAWLLWVGYRRRALLRAAWAVGIAGAIVVVCILPFTVRNYRVYSQFLLLNSNTGYAMYSAQHPMHGVSFREFDAAPLPEDLVGLGLNEAQWERELMQRGMGFILAEPGRYLRLCLSRVRDYFEFWPTRDTTLLHNVGRVGSFGLLLPFMLYGVGLALWRSPALRSRRWGDFAVSPLALLLLFAGFYSLLHILTWAMPRYRLPMDAVLLVFASLAIADLAAHLWPRRRAAVRSTSHTAV